jgi:hypothetical protein
MGILRNVSLNLPDVYELAAGTKMENIHDYYDLAKTGHSGSAQLKVGYEDSVKNRRSAVYVVQASRYAFANFWK